ncbi:MAG: sodium ion-translocating decarboxylase subunit beta [Firmicutes bacterium]|nr:sodium ion-translocating decarboxylase subunit beta [Bacillota bacterium]
MINIGEVLLNLWKDSGFAAILTGFTSEGGWQNLVMIIIACVLLYLAIVKKFEPLLLTGIAFGCLLTNLPGAGLYNQALWDAYVQGVPYVNAAGEVIEHITFTTIIHDGGLLDIFYIGVKSSLYPCLIFMGVGAMTDFGPLLSNPKSLLLGAAAQLGVFVAFLAARASGVFDALEAASIGIIGGADGPTAIYLTSKLAPHLLGAIAVAAYSYMALIPLIQPPIMNIMTTPEQRKIKMVQTRNVTKTEKIIFPIVVTIFVALLLPDTAPLIGCLMLGNLFKETGVTDRLSDTVQNALMNIVTILLSTAVGATMVGSNFLTFQTLMIVVLGVVAFGISTAGGLLGGLVMCKLSGGKINPLIGSAGVSAVPMAARVANKEGQKANPSNFLLMHAMGPNVAGVIGSAIAAGFLLSVFG